MSFLSQSFLGCSETLCLLDLALVMHPRNGPPIPESLEMGVKVFLVESFGSPLPQEASIPELRQQGVRMDPSG